MGMTTPSSHGVHAILIACVGTTMAAELPLVLEAQRTGRNDYVPYRVVCIDSPPYENVQSRAQQNGWSPQQTEAAVPRSHYFQLRAPFAETFDLQDSLNHHWKATLHEPALERLAMHPEAPGCAGTPALGRARVEYCESELRSFFERHLRDLRRARPETLPLLPGVRAFLITTLRGGTGTGATLPMAAILRSVLADPSELHLHAVMPCVYQGDDRAHANAYAMLRETQGYHSVGQRVPMLGERQLPPPFTTARFTFVDDGAVALTEQDALMQEAAALQAYLHAPTHATINARHVDLTDTLPYDPDGHPTHGRLEGATTIRPVQPGTLEYMVTAWVLAEVSTRQRRYEEWLQTQRLSRQEEEALQAGRQRVLMDLHCEPDALLARLDPDPTPVNQLRAFFERVLTNLPSLRAPVIKQHMRALPEHVRHAFGQYEAAWAEQAAQLALVLPREICDAVQHRLATTPHLRIAALGVLRKELGQLARSVQREIEAAHQLRDTVGSQLVPALNAVEAASGLFFGLFHKDARVRKAASDACAHAQAAAFARARQQRLEALLQVLESVISALRTAELEEIPASRQSLAQQHRALQERFDVVGQSIDKRSPVFQRALLHDRMSRHQLDRFVDELRGQFPDAPPLLQFLEGKLDLDQTLAELLPLLPCYTEAGRSLTELMTEPEHRALVLDILRHCRPFTTIDRIVEDQQGLRHRRDTLVILAVPGGADGPLGELMLTEAIVTSPHMLVESGEDEIRFYSLRDGLPYAVMAPLTKKYKALHDAYMANPTAISPYSRAGWAMLPGLEASRLHLPSRCEELVVVAKAVVPHRLTVRPSGGYTLCYEAETGHGFTTAKTEAFPDTAAVVAFLAKQAAVRQQLEAECQQVLEKAPQEYKAALVAAWRAASGVELFRLQHALYRLGVDPSTHLGEGK